MAMFYDARTGFIILNEDDIQKLLWPYVRTLQHRIRVFANMN